MGFNNDGAKDIEFSVLEEAIFDRHILVREDGYAAKQNLYEYVRSNHMYVHLMSEYSRLWKEHMKDWLTEHGIDAEF